MSSDLGMFASIAQAFSAGGIWMWAIFAVQIVSFAIIIERCFQLYILRAPRQRKIVNKFEPFLKSGDLEKPLKARGRSGELNPIYNVVKAGAQAADNLGGREEIRAKMDEVLLNENERLEKRTGMLAMLGNVGTLLGLLGTIVGLINAFASVSNSNPVEKAALLTQGIAMAMNTTAYGLIMAIPALIMYAVLQNRANQLNDDLNQASFKAFNWLSFNFETVNSKKS